MRNKWFLIWLFVVTIFISTVQKTYPGRNIAYATDVGGSVTTDTTFTLFDSPFDVKFSIIVDEYVALTIEPGGNRSQGCRVSGVLE